MPESDNPKTLSIYDFPQKLKQKLEKEAKDNRRSLGQHIIYLLEKKEGKESNNA